MRAGGEARGADVADHLALGDARAPGDAGGEAREVAVPGRRLRLVAQDHEVAVAAAVTARELDHAVAGRLDPRAGGSAVVDPAVRPPGAEHRVKARAAEAGGDARQLDRRAQERLADVPAVGRVVAAWL